MVINWKWKKQARA